MPFTNKERPLYEIKANLFKGLSHPYRIRLLEILAGNSQSAVSDLITQTGLEASHLSQHLAVLRRYQLVTSKRQANVVYYQLAYPGVADLLLVARQLLTDILQDSSTHQASAQDLPRITVKK